MTEMGERYLPGDSSESRESDDERRTGLIAEINREISRLHRFSTRGIRALFLFSCICLLAWVAGAYFPVPVAAQELLGKPPSARLISGALLIYTFSAIILSLCRMSAGVEHRSSFSHIGYLTAFFLIYYFAKALDGNYWAVVGSGMTILGVESYRIRTYCAERIVQKEEDREFVTRTGRPPPQE
jgi:hypothetical protein